MDFDLKNKKKGELISDNLPKDAWDFKKDGILRGYFVKKIEDIKPNNSNVYVFKVSEKTEVGIWGTTQLDKLLEKAEKGKAYEIKLVGEKPLKSNPEFSFKQFEISTLKI